MPKKFYILAILNCKHKVLKRIIFFYCTETNNRMPEGFLLTEHLRTIFLAIKRNIYLLTCEYLVY